MTTYNKDIGLTLFPVIYKTLQTQPIKSCSQGSSISINKHFSKLFNISSLITVFKNYFISKKLSIIVLSTLFLTLGKSLSHLVSIMLNPICSFVILPIKTLSTTQSSTITLVLKNSLSKLLSATVLNITTLSNQLIGILHIVVGSNLYFTFSLDLLKSLTYTVTSTLYITNLKAYYRSFILTCNSLLYKNYAITKTFSLITSTIQVTLLFPIKLYRSLLANSLIVLSLSRHSTIFKILSGLVFSTALITKDPNKVLSAISISISSLTRILSFNRILTVIENPNLYFIKSISVIKSISISCVNTINRFLNKILNIVITSIAYKYNKLLKTVIFLVGIVVTQSMIKSFYRTLLISVTPIIRYINSIQLIKSISVAASLNLNKFFGKIITIISSISTTLKRGHNLYLSYTSQTVTSKTLTKNLYRTITITVNYSVVMLRSLLRIISVTSTSILSLVPFNPVIYKVLSVSSEVVVSVRKGMSKVFSTVFNSIVTTLRSWGL